MIEYSQSQHTDAAEGEDISFKVIGVGGSGANVLDRLALEGSDDAQLLTLNTDIRKLSSSVSSQKIQLGATLLKGMGAGGDPDLGKQSAIEAVDEIREAIRGNDMVFVCVGLGGGTGSGAAPEVCRIAREEGVFLVVFATMPFRFEGARRMQQAEEALRKIESFANAVVTFDNDRMGELIVPKDGVTQAFAAADKIISQSIRATMNIVSKPGIIRIGMDDLLTALNNENSRCLFGYGQAKGDNRALDAVEQTLKCPLLDQGRLLNDAKNVLIQVSGSDSMTLLEVQTVMKEMTGHLKPSAQVLFGTGTDSRLGSSLAVTVVSSLEGKSAREEQAQTDQVVAEPTEEELTTSPLAAAVSAAAAAAVGEAHSIASAGYVEEGEGEGSHAAPPAPVAAPEAPTHLEPNIVPMEQPAAAGVESGPATPPPLHRVEPVPPAASGENSSIVAMPHFSGYGQEEDEPMTNPIASAMRNANWQHEVPHQHASPPRFPHEYASAPAPHQQPVPAAAPQQAPQQPAPVRPVSAAEEGDRVVAQTDQAQTIALSRIVPGEATQRILNRPAKESDPMASQPTKKVQPMPAATEQQLERQQDVLHLEPIAATKGRFSEGDPTIVDGEDLDVPTFLRKKG